MKSCFKLLLAISILWISYTNTYSQTEPEMVFVKGGTFKMGSYDGDKDEQPRHTVSLSSYYVSKYEITVKQYREFCNATGHDFPSNPPDMWYIEHDRAAKWTWANDKPICKVNWYDAKAYCEWLSETTGKNYDLPTEAQWEYAAKGGEKSKQYTYSGSDNINEVAWYDETTYERGPMPVGRLKPNELGIHDMSGNVWEWCLDFYAKYTSSKKNDPVGPSTGHFKVVRGGSWYYVGYMAEVTTRDGPYPDYSNYNYGFRVVINP
jgi:formylglycine-generating enzyme required for sulfatase activity